MGQRRENVVKTAIQEAVRVLGGKPGDYHTAEASRRYPYGTACVNLGGIKSKIVPRLYFSKPIARDDDVGMPYNHQRRYDYDARFALGTGPMAMDEDNRIIHTWSTEMAEMADEIWKSMKSDDRYRRLCRAGNQFNHVSVHAYRAGADIPEHEDRRRNRRNSMKEGTPVAVVTVGSPRLLSFKRKYTQNDKTIMESEPCYQFEQAEGALFILDPEDEVPKQRRNHGGARRRDANFVHSVKTVRSKDYFSVAFVFRCLETTAIVDSVNDRGVPDAPVTAKEASRRRDRALIRANDNKTGSEFKKQVDTIQAEWRRLMKAKGWM